MLNWAANIQHKDVYLEPSAGNGGIAVFGYVLGSEKTFNLSMYANEIDATRSRDLASLDIFDDIFNENAEVINDILPNKVNPSVIVMNPPFSQATRMKGKKDQRIGTRHVESAFDSLQYNGRLVALVGDGMNTQNSKHKEFFARMADKGNLRASIAIPGKAYQKFGTTFPTRILIFDKTFPDAGNKPVIDSVESLESLVPLLERIQLARISPQPIGSKPGSKKTSEGTEPSAGSPPAVRDPASGIRDVQRSADTGLSRTDEGILREKFLKSEAEGSVESSDGGRREGRRSADTGRPGQEPGERGVSDLRGTSGRDGLSQHQVKTRRNDNQQEQSELDDIEDSDVSIFNKYVPGFFVEGTSKHPAKLVESVAMALVKSPETDYEVTLEKEVIKNVSDAQSLAVILAGASFSKKLPNGETKGFALGDGTGVGKGRTIAAIMRDWWNKGHKKSVWITENSQLEDDAKRDISDVGWKDANVLSTAGSSGIKAKDTVPDQDGIFFTTYNTLKKGEGETSRMEQLVNWLGEDFDGVIAFDEAHNMGNAIDTQKSKASQKPLPELHCKTDFRMRKYSMFRRPAQPTWKI